MKVLQRRLITNAETYQILKEYDDREDYHVQWLEFLQQYGFDQTTGKDAQMFKELA